MTESPLTEQFGKEDFLPRFLSALFYQEKHATAKCKKLACKQCPQIAKNPELRNQKQNTTDSYCQGEQIDQKSFSGKIQTI